MSSLTPTRLGNETVSNTLTPGNQLNPDVALMTDGTYLVTWVSTPPRPVWLQDRLRSALQF